MLVDREPADSDSFSYLLICEPVRYEHEDLILTAGYSQSAYETASSVQLSRERLRDRKIGLTSHVTHPVLDITPTDFRVRIGIPFLS